MIEQDSGGRHVLVLETLSPSSTQRWRVLQVTDEWDRATSLRRDRAALFTDHAALPL